MKIFRFDGARGYIPFSCLVIYTSAKWCYWAQTLSHPWYYCCYYCWDLCHYYCLGPTSLLLLFTWETSHQIVLFLVLLTPQESCLRPFSAILFQYFLCVFGSHCYVFFLIHERDKLALEQLVMSILASVPSHVTSKLWSCGHRVSVSQLIQFDDTPISLILVNIWVCLS